MPRSLRFLHFNDVYHVGEREKEPVGGAARFVTAINNARTAETLTVFSGDAFNPSLISAATQGAHMVPVLNACKVDVAMYGNHDLDFGEEVLTKLSDECTFPWLMSNMVGANESIPARGKRKVVLDIQGVTVGFMGLAEKDWIDTLPDPPEDIQYRDFVQTAKDINKELREQDGVDYVVAVTHMRQPNDIKLAEAETGVDLVLGGHDHFYAVTEHGSCTVVKSGTDFREFSIVEVTLPDDKDAAKTVSVTREEVTSKVEPDETVLQLVKAQEAVLERKFNKVVGATEVPWDARVASVRTGESSLGSFACGVMRARYGADVGLLAGGTFRSDQIYGPGKLRARDIMNIFPFSDPCVVLKCSGKTLLAALENGVSKYPAHEGRFPQVSGIRFAFDPSLEPGNRIVKVTVGEERKPLDMDATYTLATRAYLSAGHDGYECFKGCEYVVSEELGSLLSSIVVAALRKVEVIKAWKVKSRIVHGAIAAWRNARTYVPTDEESEAEEDQEQVGKGCVTVTPLIDGRINILGVTEKNSLDPESRRGSIWGGLLMNRDES